jgi:hypothetical protein
MGNGPNGPLTEDAHLRYSSELHMLEDVKFEPVECRRRELDALTERKMSTE